MRLSARSRATPVGDGKQLKTAENFMKTNEHLKIIDILIITMYNEMMPLLPLPTPDI